MRACTGEAEATRAPKNPSLGSKQPPGQRQLPWHRQGTAILPAGLEWSDFVQRAGKLAKVPMPHHLSSRNTRLHQQPEDRHGSEEGGLQGQVPPAPSSLWLPSCREGRAEKRGDEAKSRGEKPKTTSWSPCSFQ